MTFVRGKSMKLHRSVVLAVLVIVLFPLTAASQQPTHSMLGNTCAGCHGTRGQSADPMPIIAGQPEEYLTRTMKSYRSGQRPSTIMGRLARGYSDDEIDAMASFFASQNWMSPKQEFDAALAAVGRKIHYEQCETCHANGGRHASGGTPRIAGQWRKYLEVIMQEYWRVDRKMPHLFMSVIMSRLHSNDLKALAHFYASQR